MSFKIPLKLIYLVKKRKTVKVEYGWIEKKLTMNPMEKHITEKNTISENVP